MAIEKECCALIRMLVEAGADITATGKVADWKHYALSEMVGFLRSSFAMSSDCLVGVFKALISVTWCHLRALLGLLGVTFS